MKRTALLIGNNAYDFKGINLNGAINDANNLGDSLKELGFDVDVKENLSGNDMGLAIASFKNSLPDYEVGLFFFAGHGFQVDGKNYLGCTDTSFSDEGSAQYTGFNLENIISALEGSKLKIKILIIDACRNHLSFGTRGLVGGFAPILAPKGMIIAFSTSPGQNAKEVGDHGVYTSALLKHIQTPKITIEEMFKRVRNTVYLETKGKQITWEHTSLMGSFCFRESVSPKIDSPYSAIAMADTDYEPEKQGLCSELIDQARTHDWNYQNNIPGILMRRSGELDSESRDDLFVLGRDLYQSSREPYAVKEWVKNLDSNLNKISVKPANDILAGMAFEIYFDPKGKLREKFKIMPEYKGVLSELCNTRYKESLTFIRGKLDGYDQRVMYIPGDEAITVYVQLQEDTEENVFYVKEIMLDGIDIMYDEDGNELYNYKKSYSYGNSIGTVDDLYESIREKMVATKRGVAINVENMPRGEAKISIPRDYMLLRYGNSIKEELA